MRNNIWTILNECLNDMSHKKTCIGKTYTVGQFKFVRWIKYLYWSSVFGDSSCSVIMDHNRYVIDKVSHIAWIIQNESWLCLLFRNLHFFRIFQPRFSTLPVDPWYGPYHMGIIRKLSVWTSGKRVKINFLVLSNQRFLHSMYS